MEAPAPAAVQQMQIPSNLTKICFILPPKINSGGIMESPRDFLTYALPLIQLQMLLIFLISHTLHFFLKRFGTNLFVSQALSGIILGPTLLGRTKIMRTQIFPHWSQNALGKAARFGFAAFIFLTGVKMDTSTILRSGRKVMIIGVIAIIAPLVFGVGFMSIMPGNWLGDRNLRTSIILISVQCFTTFPAVAGIISELKIVNAELGRLGLSAAIISDILGLFLLILLSITKTISGAANLKDAIALFAFVLASAFVIRPAMRLLIEKTPDGKPVNPTCIYLIMAAAFFSEMYFSYSHQVQYMGPFIFGLAVPAGPPLGSTLVDKFETVTLWIFVPIFVSTSMMRADLNHLIPAFLHLKYYVIVIVLIFGIKFVACFIPTLYSKMLVIDSLALTLLMCCKGIVELAMYSFCRDNKLISEDVYALVSFCLLINAAVVPILVKRLYDPSRKYVGYQAKNIMSLKPNSELRIVACIHRPDNVAAVISLLDATVPTKERPIGVYILHLIELVGRAAPVFITHQTHYPVSNSCSENVVLSFTQYERINWGVVTVNNFTAISPRKLMYEDIFTLALDKLSSLILIPLHRKWGIDGSIESDDNGLRTLNLRVLETAPCSVGIFFDRGKLGRRHSKTSSIMSVCMIFLGGGDDREALTLAKRMGKDSNISLTLIQLVPEDRSTDSEDSKLDAWELEDFMQNFVDIENVRCLEQVVRDGPQTALIVRTLADEFDLFLVGRRYGIECQQTVGLSDWSEFPELGIIGDLLASKDLNTRASVLVLQQHN